MNLSVCGCLLSLFFNFIRISHAWIPSSPTFSLGTKGITITTTTTTRRPTLPLAMIPISECDFFQYNNVVLAHSSDSFSSAFQMILSNTDDVTKSVSSWRQYVPIVASSCVILDIALGKPVLNAIMKPISSQQQQEYKNDDDPSPTSSQGNPKERVNTEKIAQEALQQAYASMELRKYLEENKSDAQRLQEIRQRMDAEMKQVDSKLEEQRKNTS